MLLAHLLLNDVVFVNTLWADDTWPEETRGGVVNCNDCFSPLYHLWRRDPIHGSLAWLIARRKERT